jgi:hypothetical protein
MVVLSAALSCACAPPLPTTPGRFGEITSAIVVMNPVINQGSSTTVATGTARSGIPVRAGDAAAVPTDSGGLALLEGLPTGSVPIRVEGASVPLDVVQDKDLYDVVVAWDGSTLRHVIPPVRYPIGAVTVVEPGGNLASALAADDAVVVLKPGTYSGNLELRASRVLLFGAWSEDDGPLSIIEGDVTVQGGGNRIRGVKITGRLTSSANNFSAAFNDVGSTTLTGNAVSLLRNRFTGTATVPSTNAVLLDNGGLP